MSTPEEIYSAAIKAADVAIDDAYADFDAAYKHAIAAALATYKADLAAAVADYATDVADAYVVYKAAKDAAYNKAAKAYSAATIAVEAPEDAVVTDHDAGDEHP